MYTVRTFTEGDAPKLVSLFNLCYQSYSGLTIRNSSRWLWEIAKNPDVEKRNILVFLEKEEPVGYLVLARSGRVYEMAYNPFTNAHYLVTYMLSEAERLARNQGMSHITVTAPSDNQLLHTMLKASGFREGPVGAVVSAKFTAAGNMLQKMANRLELTAITPSAPFLFVVRNPREGETWVEVELGDTTNQPNNQGYRRAATVIYLEEETLVEILLGSTSPLKAIATRKISVHPFYRIFKVLRLLKQMKVAGPLFIPFSDWA